MTPTSTSKRGRNSSKKDKEVKKRSRAEAEISPSPTTRVKKTPKITQVALKENANDQATPLMNKASLADPVGPGGKSRVDLENEASDIEMAQETSEPVTSKKAKLYTQDLKTPPSAAKTAYNARLSEIDKVRLIADDKSIWASLNKATPKRTTAYKQLFSFLTEKSGKDVQQITFSSTSFYVIVYKSQNKRDLGLQKLKNVKFEVNEQKVDVALAKFGDVGGTRPYTYQLLRGPMDSAQDVQAALNTLFKAKNTAVPAYRIQEIVTSKIPISTFIISFITPVHLGMKTLEIGTSKQDWLIGKEGMRCILCSGKGHKSVECNVSGCKAKLSENLVTQKPKAVKKKTPGKK
ncbi:hypothetical protein BDDG_09605 [Blastomyces dermatitidis ATCC 18188]|uniref:Uncharacterized protein n=1 Tax=Ajellomyces dermatitidis (strain ATCC 18188 / CBS 674.68) TaxID=653446 RepID=F2TTU5_AJEDA|nr:hypothetical protein BDDG_09605 [Blastomyces dermatitidis ATCC 18188]